jgi:hypothetical protein
MARQYVAGKTVNCYGQRVVVASLGVASAYEMDERPRDGAEIYSHIQFISVRDSRKALLRPWKEFGRSDTAFARRFAWMFIEGQIKSGFDEWVARRRPRAAGAKRREQSR